MIVPSGPQAYAIDRLWNVALATSIVVYALTMAVLWRSVRRARTPDRADEHLPEHDSVVGQRGIAVATALTIVVLFAFLIGDLIASRRLGALERAQALTVRVTGQQWWWRVEYLDTIPQRQVSTANEIHVPVGVPVQLELRTSDVIHSFWVPALHGKRDLLPNHRNHLWIQADTPGVYRGQCAEFCGYQHAKMALAVVAHTPAEYDRWYARQLVAVDTLRLTSAQQAGRRVFERSTCTMCHAIRGTAAGGSAGPELTHVGSRWALAAGAAPNDDRGMAEWLRDPQQHKPGTRMPTTALTTPERDALVHYLRGLP